MSLLQQPFSHVPELDRLGKELFMNLSDNERAASAAIGVGMVVVGLVALKPLRWVLCVAGAAMARRAFTGHCPVYQQLHLDTRHPH